MIEATCNGYKFLHTDVLFQVDEYLGPNKIPYDKLIIRHTGGMIGDYVHICEQEQLSVGEEVIIFCLSKPEEMVQVPEEYDLEQYYLFQPASKYVSSDGRNFKPDFSNEPSVDINTIRALGNN